MVHNGIEYGLLQAYAEGFALLRHGAFPLDLPGIARLWNRGSVVRSWILELAHRALQQDPGLDAVRGHVEDSGEGRWTVQEAIELGIPTPAIAAALWSRFRSRTEENFSDKVIAALRREFGGHAVKPREASCAATADRPDCASS
jgi:6-phosphogluconate dehydrogenase